jgi:uncharacterized protein (TIGR03067 family)
MSATVACLLLFPLLSLAADRPAQPPLKKELLPLQGTWKLESLEVEGSLRDFPGPVLHWVIRGDKVRYGGQELATLTLDVSTTPRSVDLGFLSPKRVYEGVYEVKGATLKICVNKQTDGVKERPLGFATKDKPNLRLLVFKRQKDGKGDKPEDLPGFVGMMIKYKGEDPREVVVADVFEGSPGKRAGLKKDDVLLKVGEAQVTDLRSIIDRTRQAKPGSKLTLRIRRDGKERDVTVKVGVMPFFLLD